MRQLMANSNKSFCRADQTLGELCEDPRCLLWRRLRRHCPMYNACCIFFNKCIYFSYYMAYISRQTWNNLRFQQTISSFCIKMLERSKCHRQSMYRENFKWAKYSHRKAKSLSVTARPKANRPPAAFREILLDLLVMQANCGAIHQGRTSISGLRFQLWKDQLVH